MGSSEAEEGHAAVDVLEVVVGVGNVELALVFVGVAVAVAGERCLVVVVEEGVAKQRKERSSAVVNLKRWFWR